MNSKDFIVLPWGKSGNSVKLKYKNSLELKMEKTQLELENQEMEKKLQEFQFIRSKEKEERQSSEYHWKSGQVGKLSNQSHMISQNKKHVTKFSAGKVKLKLLKEQLQGPVKQLSNKTTNSFEGKKFIIKGKVCGQCENKAALLVCLECGEDYCSVCFAKIHQKGALKLHRTSLLQKKPQISPTILDVAHQFIKEVTPNEKHEEHHFTEEICKNQPKPKSVLLQDNSSEVEVSTIEAEYKNPKEKLLCEESFDKEAFTLSFQNALNHKETEQGGNEKLNLAVTKADSWEVSEVQTDLKIWREPLKIEFKEDSLSYMEKLWLKKHKSTLQEKNRNVHPDTFMAHKTASEAECSHNENNQHSDVEENKAEHEDIFLPAQELNLERCEPTLKIIELDDTYEEDFEEIGNIVPYKVELADTNCQQSYASHDDQNSFLYENGILHRHFFIKSKTDFLHRYLSSRFSYCKDNLRAGASITDLNNSEGPDASSHATKEVVDYELFKRKFEERSIKRSQRYDDSHILHNRKDSLPNVDLEKPSSREKLSEDEKESLKCVNLHLMQNFEISKASESSLLRPGGRHCRLRDPKPSGERPVAAVADLGTPNPAGNARVRVSLPSGHHCRLRDPIPSGERPGECLAPKRPPSQTQGHQTQRGKAGRVSRSQAAAVADLGNTNPAGYGRLSVSLPCGCLSRSQEPQARVESRLAETWRG
ncbi:zinc finger B-box domain-containing protein 1 [Suncus etruscus]|uniref:zinc finger B-box domain-containing protein 1 n=1 Tax=Suncus etruscus TaxID=109475 RepID=UPI0021109DCF|nr:zinc finger B-box domain-containing protein 1 [Suncus etruscus]